MHGFALVPVQSVHPLQCTLYPTHPCEALLPAKEAVSTKLKGPGRASPVGLDRPIPRQAGKRLTCLMLEIDEPSASTCRSDISFPEDSLEWGAQDVNLPCFKRQRAIRGFSCQRQQLYLVNQQLDFSPLR